MGSIFLPATIDTPKKEIVRYEGGYIRNIFGTLIGRYDDKCVYEGASILNTNFIGRMDFNYGYLRSSNDIFVKSHKDGYLSVGENRYAAYFDGDEKGAIAAFILAYLKGMITLPSYYSSEATTIYNNNGTTEKNYSGSGDNVAPGAGIGINGCLGVIVVIIFIIAAIYSSFTNWWDLFTTPISAKQFEENWVAILPLISMVVGIVRAIRTKTSIVEAFIAPFAIQIIIVAILYAIYARMVILGIILGLIGSIACSIVPFVIGVIIAYIMKKIM